MSTLEQKENWKKNMWQQTTDYFNSDDILSKFDK